MNGISYVGPLKPVTQAQFNQIERANSNWVSLMPFAYLRDAKKPELISETKWQWWGEGRAGTRKLIKFAKSQGQKVMVKPQIWIMDGAFTGHLKMEHDSDWSLFESAYTSYIVDYAKIAEEENVELFCIGTELNAFVSSRSTYWMGLIDTVKEVYSGKLTYAENWDSYQKVPFWKALDYIGVDAYFPLSEEVEPSEEALTQAWEKIADPLKNYAEQQGKKILFTEWGYRSIDQTSARPWEEPKDKVVNQQTQAMAYKAIFNTIWDKEWYAGGFVWKWFSYEPVAKTDRTYSPQGKEAEKVLKRYYSKYQ